MKANDLHKMANKYFRAATDLYPTDVFRLDDVDEKLVSLAIDASDALKKLAFAIQYYADKLAIDGENKK